MTSRRRSTHRIGTGQGSISVPIRSVTSNRIPVTGIAVNISPITGETAPSPKNSSIPSLFCSKTGLMRAGMIAGETTRRNIISRQISFQTTKGRGWSIFSGMEQPHSNTVITVNIAYKQSTLYIYNNNRPAAYRV